MNGVDRDTTTSPRESMRSLPRVVQPFLTWVTGVPLDGAGPRVRWRPGLAAVAGVVQTCAGIALGAYGLTLPWYGAVLVLAVAWPVTAGGMRRLDVVVVHQTLHRMFARSHLANRVTSEIITTLLWRPPYDENRTEHLLHHAYPCSLKDGDTLYLQSTGAGPGRTRADFRRYLLRAVLSPRHHAGFLRGRLKANFLTTRPVYRAVMAWTYLAATVGVLAVTGGWLHWLLLWVVPATFFFHNQTLLYTLSEHRWWLFDNREGLTKAQRDQLTFGRFVGRPTPDTSGAPRLAAAAAWCAWWLRMVVLYAPYRMCVLVGDTVQHDLHHVRPNCDWANSAHVRQNHLRTSPERYFEAWGGLLTHVYVGNMVVDFDVRPSAELVGQGAS